MPKLGKSAPKAAKKKRMADEMGKFKMNTLHSGSKTGPKVASPAQAKAIALSESGQSKEMPGKKEAGSKNMRAIADKNSKKRKTRRSS